VDREQTYYYHFLENAEGVTSPLVTTDRNVAYFQGDWRIITIETRSTNTLVSV
jgi:hypothetical protein